TLRFDHEAVLAGALAVLAAVVLVLRVGDRDPSERRSAGVRTIAWGFVVFGVVIALPWLAVDNPQGLGFRLRVAAFVPLAICAALVTAAAARVLAGWHRDAALLALAIVIARAPHTRTEGRVLAHP